MRALIVPILALATVTFVACGRTDRDRLGHDVHAVADDLKADAHKLASNPDLKHAGAEVRHTADQAGAALKSTGHEAANGLRHAGNDIKRATK